MGEELFVRLRDCFTAGYTLPQYCIDNNIKRPLFVSEKKYELFLWEVYVQFKYDKRLTAQFGFIDSDKTQIHFKVYGGRLVLPLTIQNISDIKLDDFDKIILFTNEKINVNKEKVVPFIELERFFIQQVYCDIPLLNFLQRHPKVKLFVTNFPYNAVKRCKNWIEFYSELWEYQPLKEALKDAESKNINIPTPFDKLGYTNSQAISLLKDAFAKRHPDGTTTMFDDDDPLIQIKDGKRITAYQPEHFQNRIYILGTCHHFGTNAPFDKTIASYLQKILNEHNLPYRVENEGQCYSGRYQYVFYNLNKLNPMPGDIIFIFIENLMPNKLPFCNVEDAFDPYDCKDIFCRKAHVNEIGYKALAEKYFKFLTENNFFRDTEFTYPLPPPPHHRYGIPPQFEQGGMKSFANEELETYKKTLRAKKLPVGALVMNCNPFTLGHQYLVEYAAAQVVKLYIFVVEEDKSEFPFEDRIELVRQGVKHIPNVEVLPSGKFIISQQTFSGYFNKAELQDVAVDSSEDVEIFAKEIAPTLGITVRFAGEEPNDNVTRQYNETMKIILPRYGVEFREIPRKEISGEPISASSVREALKAGDFDKVKTLVPETTFNYLHEHHVEFLRHFTARMNIKFFPSATGDFQIISVSDDKASVWKPKWFQNNGIGYQIHSYVGHLEVIAKAETDGKINLMLMGLDIRDPKNESKRIPYWIDYTKLTVNGEKQFDTLTPTWHNKPYHYTMEVKADEEIIIQVEWLPHKKDT